MPSFIPAFLSSIYKFFLIFKVILVFHLQGIDFVIRDIYIYVCETAYHKKEEI